MVPSRCDDAATNKKFELKTANTQREHLEATIAKTKGDAEVSDAKIEELASAVAASTKDLKDATLIREKEAADFGGEETELVEVIGTLGRAIAIIEREMSKNPAAFTQAGSSSSSSFLPLPATSSSSQVDSSNIQSLVKTLGTIRGREIYPAKCLSPFFGEAGSGEKFRGGSGRRGRT